jgi:predicted ATPase
MCERLGETPQLFPVLWGLARIYDHRDLSMGREMGEQLLALAERVQDPALLLEAHHERWANAFSLGEFATVLTHTERGGELYNPEEHRQYAFLYGGHDPGVCGLRHAAMTLWLLGYPDRALETSRVAVSLAQKLSHPYSLVHALFYAAWVHQHRGERQAVSECIEASVTLATEQEFTRWVLQGATLQGWLLSQHGKGQEGILKMRQGVTAVREQSHFAAPLAEACGKVGQTEEGLRIMNEELARVHKIGECFYEAELHRITGELLLGQAVTDEAQAEICFQKALEIARSQSAKSLELRAAMSLTRLWRKRGKQKEARQLLSEVYHWFTEGFGTADLKAAKALLHELASGEETT